MNRLQIDLNKRKENSDKIIYYEPEPDFAGSQWLPVVYDAIQDTRIISFLFTVYDHQENHFVHPYFLKEYAGRWYVIGLEDDKPIYYGLDRISDLQILDTYYRKNESKDEGMRKNLELNLGIMDFHMHRHGVHIVFDSSLAHDIKSHPFLANQHILFEDSNEILISLEVVINEEFIKRVIFPYGDKAVVVGPPFAVDLVVRTLTKMLDLHKVYGRKPNP